MSTVLLFVYGSLKRGFRHHDELRGACFLRAARTKRGFRLVRYGEYPALARAHHGGDVQGELYRLPAERLPELDEFEECPSLYQRESIELADGSVACTYLVSNQKAADLEEIDGGIWQED